MALNEIAKHFYEKEIDRLLDSEDRNIIKEKFLDMRSSIDDLYVELGERARRISKLEAELETANKVFADVNGIAKRQFDRNEKQEKELKFFRDEAQKQSWKVSELDRALCVKGDLLKKTNEKICELESELERSREYTETLRRMLGLRSAKENIELVNKLYGLNFEVPDDEEPLPFSSDEYEEDFPEELRSKDLNFNLVSKMLDVIELMLTDTQS